MEHVLINITKLKNLQHLVLEITYVNFNLVLYFNFFLIITSSRNCSEFDDDYIDKLYHRVASYQEPVYINFLKNILSLSFNFK